MRMAIKLSNFSKVYCLHLHRSGSPTLEAVSNSHHIPKDTKLHQQRSTNLHCSQPTLYRTSQFQTLAQPSFSAVHLTANVNTDGKFVLCIITWALVRGELLGSHLDRFIPVEENQCLLTRRLFCPRDFLEFVK